MPDCDCPPCRPAYTHDPDCIHWSLPEHEYDPSEEYTR